MISTLMAVPAGAEVPVQKPAPDFALVAQEVSRDEPSAAPIRFVEEAPYGRDKRIARFVLANGLTVLVLEDHSAPLLSYQTWFAVGSRHETRGKTGLAHLFEHLMFKGTKRHPHAVFDRLLEEAGAQTNAATWVDWTFYYENLPSGGLELAVRLEADRMANLALDQDQLTQELDVVKNERRLRVDNDPDGVMDEAMLASVFPTHPYGMPTIGYMADLEGLTLEDCLGFYRTWYAPSNATVVLVGDVDLRESLALIARNYGPLTAVAAPASNPAPEAEQTARRDLEMKLPIATEKVKMAWRTVPANHRDAYALDVANEVLFANESSRVYRTLVEDLELASEVDGASEPLALDGLFIVDLVLNEGKAAAPAAAEVFKGLARLAAEGPSEAELSRAKNHLEASFLRSLATVGSRATQIGASERVAGSFRKVFEFVDGIRAVGPDDVRRVVGRYLAEPRATVVFGRP